MSTIDLSQLPAPNVIESLEYESLLAQRKAEFIALYPVEQQAAITQTLTLESEPIVKLLQENAYRELILRARINEAARAVMLGFAVGADLDQIAANYAVERLVIQPADTSVVPPLDAVMESDAALRERTQEAFEGLSVAGPRGAYVFHARSADGRVADASAISPAPCYVTVSVLATEGNGSAPQDLLAAVSEALNDEDIRPLGDRLTVQSAQIVPYTIAATLYLFPGPESEPIRAAAEAALQTYVSAQRRIGRDIRRSAIFAALHVEGVQRVEIAQPAADVVLDDTQAAYCTGYTVTVGGTDE